MPDYFYLILFGLTSVFIALSWIKSGNFFNPVSIFNLWWGFLIFVSTLQLAGLRLPTLRAYSLIILSVSMFSIGGITFLSPAKLKLNQEIKKNNSMSLKLKLFFAFQIVLMIVLLFYLRIVLGILSTMDPGLFRGLVFDEAGIMGERKFYVFYIVLPSLYMSAFISITGVIFNRIKLRFLFLSLFNLILYSMVTVGRAPIFIAVMGFTFGIIYIFQIKKLKIKPSYVLLASIPFIFILSMSVFRKSSGGSVSINILTIFSNYFVWYFTGPFTALDYFLDFCKEGVGYHYTYARAVFAGLEDLFLPVIKKIFSDFSPVNESIHSFTKIFRNLGGGATHHNSHYTMVMEFMWDAGIYGVVVYSYLFGAIVSKVYNSFRVNHSISNYGILLVLTYLSLMGIMRWELRYIWTWGTMIGIFFFSTKFFFQKNSLRSDNAS